MKHTLVGQIPAHKYCWVDSTHTHKEPSGFVPAIWYGLVSYPGRVWGCTVLLESGAIYRNLPPHAIAFNAAPDGVWTAQDAQTWDCYGWEFATLEYDYLRGLECRVLANNQEHIGEYMFTVAPVGDAYSADPGQSKEFTFVKLDNGWMTIQPTNHTVFRERSFTDNKLEFPRGLKRQTEIWTVE